MRVAALALAACALTPDGQQTTPPAFAARTDLVVIDVSVRRGRASIKDLAASEFRVTDNGVPQDVQFVESQAVPVDVTVLDDSWTIMRIGHTGDRSPAATELQELAQLLRPGDRLGMLTSTTTPRELLPLTLLPADLPRLRGSEGLNRLVDALALALLTRGAPGRRHVLLGELEAFDSWSVTDPTRLTQLALGSDVIVEIGMPTARMASRASMLAFGPLAALTGGDLFPADNAKDALRHVIGALTSSYFLGYRPSGVAREGWHAISVTVTRPGPFVIGARQGYVGE